MTTKDYEYKTERFTYEGKRYTVYGKTPKEAEKKKQKKIAALDAGKAAYTKDKNITFRDYSKKWLDVFNKKGDRGTRKDVERRLKNFILPHIGDYRMKDITRSDLVALFDGMSGYSKDRINKVRQTLRKVLEAAYDDGYISKIPNLKMVDTPEGNQYIPRRSIKPYERELTLRVAKYHRAGPWILMILYCGLRPGEIAALQGRHIDFKKKQITIEQSRKVEGNIDTTKTVAGKRIVPIPTQLLPFLPVTEPFDFVFKSPGRKLKGGKREPGKRMTKTTQKRAWESFKEEMQIQAGCNVVENKLVPSMTLVEGCGHHCMMLYPQYIRDGFRQREYPIMDDLVPYCYRHTFCTDAVTAGVTIELLKDLAGHEDISTTAKYYIDVTDERLNQAADLLAVYHSER